MVPEPQNGSSKTPPGGEYICTTSLQADKGLMPDDLDVELLSIRESRIQRDGNLFDDARLPYDVGDGSRFYIVEFFHLRFSSTG